MAVRQEKMAALIKKVISNLLVRRIKDPRIGFVSVINVEVSKDLAVAKAKVSIYGSEEDKAKTMKGLNSARGLIRTEVGKALGVRHAPEIQFILDDGIEHSIKVSQILSGIYEEE